MSFDLFQSPLMRISVFWIALPPVQEGQPVAATNALLLGYLYRPYTAHAGFVRLTYAW